MSLGVGIGEEKSDGKGRGSNEELGVRKGETLSINGPQRR